MALTKDTLTFPVTLESDVTTAIITDAIAILDKTDLITSVAFSSGGTTVTLTTSSDVVTITDGSASTTMADTNYSGIAGVVIAYLNL